jgi:hypothetical protein
MYNCISSVEAKCRRKRIEKKARGLRPWARGE